MSSHHEKSPIAEPDFQSDAVNGFVLTVSEREFNLYCTIHKSHTNSSERKVTNTIFLDGLSEGIKYIVECHGKDQVIRK